MSPSSRLLIVSNRLPVVAHLGPDGVRLNAASGGLATGLRDWHEKGRGCWIGWPGDVSTFTPDQQRDLDRRLRDRAIVPVLLERDLVERSYQGFSNRVLWPLFHYLIDRVPVDASGWDAYRRVNEAFADAVVREYRRGDSIWVHDYHLMLVPALLRDRLPEARIGFFLHIPFPSSEVFRILPWRRQVLTGLLGADLVGFHTFAHMRHFLASLLHVDGVEAEVDRVRSGGRYVSLGVFPMGVDAARFSALAEDPGIVAQAEAIRRDVGGRRILLGIDRLDYTKGIPRRLHAIERLLAVEPDLRDTVRYLQLAVPSRGEVDSYQRFRRQVEEIVGRINGTYGTLRSIPVQYVHRAVSTHELVALYRAADVMLVTPLRDGMNLVAKEFVASRVHEDGVLVLSEFAGAAAELDGAVVVNPYDIEGVAGAVRHALSMGDAEQRARMRTLRRRVAQHDVHAWATSFLDRLAAARPIHHLTVLPPAPSLVTALGRLPRSTPSRWLLDYDGTLVPIVRSPELAAPDDELLALLQALAACPGAQVDLVSGRPRWEIEDWFGKLPVSLWAEHGFWHRPGPDARWEPTAIVEPDWARRLLPILEQFTASTPGSRIEMKTASVAWHYREAQREHGARQAHELRMLLGDALSNQPLEVLEGKKVIEVRVRGVSKAAVMQRGARIACEQTVIAFGDDRTDEDLFRVLPSSSIAVAVGRPLVGATYEVEDFRTVRDLLRSFVAERTADRAPAGVLRRGGAGSSAPGTAPLAPRGASSSPAASGRSDSVPAAPSR